MEYSDWLQSKHSARVWLDNSMTAQCQFATVKPIIRNKNTIPCKELVEFYRSLGTLHVQDSSFMSDEYIEKELMCVDANFRQDIISTHHFSANAEIAAVDYTRYERLSKILKT